MNYHSNNSVLGVAGKNIIKPIPINTRVHHNGHPKNVTFPNKDQLITSLSNQFALNSKSNISNNNSSNLQEDAPDNQTRPYQMNNVILNGHHMSNNERGILQSAFNQIKENHQNNLSSKINTINQKNKISQIRPTTVIISSNKRPDRIKTTPQYVTTTNNNNNNEIILLKNKPEITRINSPNKLNCLDNLTSYDVSSTE